MSRAFLFVLDSFGIGGAEDAARFGDSGSNTFGHIDEACAAGKADREGLRRGPLDLPNMMSLGQRLISESQALSILDVWLTTPFEGGRHERRVAKLDR